MKIMKSYEQNLNNHVLGSDKNETEKDKRRNKVRIHDAFFLPKHPHPHEMYPGRFPDI